MLRNSKETQASTVPEPPGQNKRGSIFIDILTRTRKASAVPNQTPQNQKVYTVPDASARGRKGSTFTDLLSKNRKVSNVQENGIPKSGLNFRKTSIIMEEVRQKPEYFVAVHFLTKLMDIFIFFSNSQMIRRKFPSLPLCRLWRRIPKSWLESRTHWTDPWLLWKSSTTSLDTPSSGLTSGYRSLKSHSSAVDISFRASANTQFSATEMRFTVRSANSFMTTTIVQASSVAGSCCRFVWAFFLPVSDL